MREHLHPIAVLALSIGIRQGEMMGLEWSAHFLKEGWLFLVQTKPVSTIHRGIKGALK